MSVQLVELGEDGTIEVCGVPLKRKLLAKLRLKARSYKLQKRAQES